jgi:hypothetical protein
MTRRLRLSPLIFCGLLCWSAPVRADVVTDWNARMVSLALARPGPSGILDFAVVNAAMHDAIQAFEKRFEPYAISISSASGSPVAAAATAAHDVLVARFPAEKAALDDFYDDYLQARHLEGDPGILVGMQAAAAILARRTGDGSFPPSFQFVLPPPAPGVWRPTLPLFAAFAAPWLGTVTPFTLKTPDQFAADEPPPQLTSGRYTHDYNEVKALGALVNSARTPEQTALAVFFSGNFLALWNLALRNIATEQHLALGDSARLFALAYLASADALITAWNDKAHYLFWRPITAIQEGDHDGNPRTAGDTAWLPFLATPPYPDYTSGANNLSSAMTRMLARFFGSDRMNFTLMAVLSPTITLTRDYTRFSDVEDDVVEVRIYQGIHFRTADQVARREGKHVADWTFSHALRPIQ